MIAAEGEQKASRALKEASEVIAESSSALQLRYLQTLNSISAEKNSTIIFPLPIDLVRNKIAILFFSGENQAPHPLCLVSANGSSAILVSLNWSFISYCLTCIFAIFLCSATFFIFHFPFFAERKSKTCPLPFSAHAVHGRREGRQAGRHQVSCFF